MITNVSISQSLNARADKPALCPKHGVPIQWFENIVGEHDFGYSCCPLCAAEEDRAAREAAAAERYARLIAEIPYHYHGACLDQFDAAFIAPVLDWVKRPKGFIYIYGGPGVGKTHLACAVKRDFNERGVSSRLVFSSDMLIEISRTFHAGSNAHAGDIVDKYAGNRFAPVIFDDVGVQKRTDYTADAWFNILDRRYRSNAPTMITTNLEPIPLGEAISARVLSRIKSGLVFEFPKECPDLRYKEHWTERY